MIEANDLMIGNYVRYNGMILPIVSICSPKPYKTKRFNEKWLIELLCDGLIYAPIDEVEPIPITEDILLKCEGIENEFDMCLKINDRAALAIDVKPNAVIATIFTEYDEFEVKCDYLHELQILYKSLASKDLIINF